MKKLISLFLSFALVIGFSACSNSNDTEEISVVSEVSEESETQSEPTPEPTSEPTLEPISEYTNPLTGIVDLTDEAIGSRPVAVMINNLTVALPQYGIGDADIIFEVPVEGTITRLMAIYADYTRVPDICSVRSARYYFPIISESFDAIYVHWGSNTQFADPELEELGTDNLNGMTASSSLFGRDQDRLSDGYSLEHTGVLYGSYIPTAMANNGYDTEISEDKAGLFFNFNSEPTPANGEELYEFQFDYGAYYSDFVYDEENQVYLKFHNGSEHIEGTTGEQLSFTNVFILETAVNDMPNGSSGVQEIDVTSDGSKIGYYISNGCIEKITWKKETKQDMFTFYTLDGEELSINVGKTYIGIGDPTYNSDLFV